MSIINDALKKVQQSLSSSNQQPPASTPAPEPINTPLPQTKAVSPFDEPSPTPSSSSDGPVEVLKKDNEQLKKNILAALITLGVIIVSAAVTWFQIKDMPQVKEWQALYHAKVKRATTLKMSTKDASEIKPLAQLTVEQSAPAAAAAPTSPEASAAAPIAVEEIKPLAPLTLNIHGVMANGDTNIALINNQVYQEGDTVQGVKILKISLTEIVVLNNGREQTIAVGK